MLALIKDFAIKQFNKSLTYVVFVDCYIEQSTTYITKIDASNILDAKEKLAVSNEILWQFPAYWRSLIQDEIDLYIPHKVHNIENVWCIPIVIFKQYIGLIKIVCAS